MEEEQLVQETQGLIQQDFQLKTEAFLSEQDLVQALAAHVEEMMKYKIEVLMSTLYRLDVSEKKVALALMPNAPEPAHIGIARLIIERQKKRLITKKTYKPQQLDDWMDF